MSRLLLASIGSLGLLSGFIVILVIMIMVWVGIPIHLPAAIGITIAWNVLMWAIGPKISDLIYEYLYKVEWVGVSWLEKRSPESARIIREVSQKYGFREPQIGIIPDKNPNAFTYGSIRSNSRIIVTEWIFVFLDEGERAAVYGHELGHIKNNDFIIMTIASTLLQVVYEIYFFSKEMSKRKGSSGKKGNPFAVIALVAYIFYVVWNYTLLYLSRIREYFADAFSAEHTDPNNLAKALVKIALGILATPENNRLVESTKHIGIASTALSQWLGLLYMNCEKAGDFAPLAKSFLFDLKSPWAWVAEFSSTHPLTGKRIKALMKFTNNPLYDIEGIEQRIPIDRVRLYGWFWRDIFILILSRIAPLLWLILGMIIILSQWNKVAGDILLAHILWYIFMGISVSIFLMTKLRYGDMDEKSTTVLEALSDIYASPVRGKRIALEWTIIWKWIPGYVFSEDLMLQDKTGLIYLDYESKIPIIGNLIFSLRRVNEFIEKSVKTNGWFFRGISSHMVINEVSLWSETIKWWAKFWGVIGSAATFTWGMVLVLL